jgi:predicted ester cyclase
MSSTVATRSPRRSLAWQALASGPLESRRLTPEKVLLPGTASTSCLPRPIRQRRIAGTKPSWLGWGASRGRRSAATGPDHNKRLVRRALEEIYANGDLELADELIHPDFVDHEPAHPDQPTGPESVRQTVRQLHGAFGGLRFEVEDEIAEGDKVVQLVVMSGRHTGSLMGREPTGREFAVRHVYIWRIAGGRIVEHWGSRDDLGLLGQLGLLELQS